MTGAVARPHVYLEDAPLRADVPGRGLARLNAALLAGLQPASGNILLAQMHGTMPPDTWDDRFRDRIVSLGNLRCGALKIARRLTSGAADRIAARTFMGRPFSRSSVQGWLFAPVGSDVGTAERALIVARGAGLRCALYFVDDPIAARAVSGLDRRTGDRLCRIVKAADACLAITDALADRIVSVGAPACHALPLPFEARPAPAPTMVGRYVVHIGAINHIYRSGLLATARAMAAVDAGLRLRLTSTPDQLLLAELTAQVPVEISSADGTGALEALLADALCAVVPVEREPSAMYATSFPSKLLEYLNACRRIVVLGPDDASAVRFFRQHGLGSVATSEAGLSATLAGLLAAPVDNADRYRAALSTTNAPSVFAAALDAALAGRR